jgi:hypothetical protein
MTNVVVYTSLPQALEVKAMCVDRQAEHDQHVKAVSSCKRHGE